MMPNNKKAAAAQKSPYKVRHVAGHNKIIRSRKDKVRKKPASVKAAHMEWLRSIAEGDAVGGARRYREFMR